MGGQIVGSSVAREKTGYTIHDVIFKIVLVCVETKQIHV